MRLTTYTDYALRVLMRLALQPERLTTIADVASDYRISENHLMKVVHQLGLAGFVETVRGKNGGLKLGRPPSEINVGQVVRRMEPDMELVPCFEAANACVLTPACELRDVLVDARDAFLAVLDDYTLDDLVQPRRRLSALFRPKDPRPS
jgi:Rrf2 family transcriptional regulator, nitric oxide-sensitive transcriptional repressor